MSNISKLKRLSLLKESLSTNGKRKLLHALKLCKKTYLNEDIIDKPERNVIAKTFDTKADFDSYVNQHRGIEMTAKELQSIVNYNKVKPTQQDKFFVKFESTDTFGNNNTTVIKKLKEGNQYCWTAFSKHEGAETKEVSEADVFPQGNESDEVVVDDTIRITKTITFVNDADGANILSDFLIKLDI